MLFVLSSPCLNPIKLTKKSLLTCSPYRQRVSALSDAHKDKRQRLRHRDAKLPKSAHTRPRAHLEQKRGAVPPCSVQDSRIDSVQSIVAEAYQANHADVQWLCKELIRCRRRKAPFLSDTNLARLTRQKVEKDRAAVGVAKKHWLENSERKLHWLNLRRLTQDAPHWGYYDSALQMLDNRKRLPFQFFSPICHCNMDTDYPLTNVGRCFENARMGRIFTTYKLLMIYALYVVLAPEVNETEQREDEERTIRVRSRFHTNVLQNTQFVYPISVPTVLDDILADCCLYDNAEERSRMLIPNCGYVFGGEVQREAPLNRGLDCTSFLGWISGCGRPLTYLYELAWRKMLGEDAEIESKEDQEMIDVLCRRHDVIRDYSQVQPGDVLIWRHVVGGGHAMLVQEVRDDTVLTVECTNYKDGHYEGFEERVVTIQNPTEGGREAILRPKYQDCFLDFRERSSALTFMQTEA